MGSFKSRAIETAFTFAIGGAIFLAAHSITSESASAQLHPATPPPGAITAPVQRHGTPQVAPVPPPLIVQRPGTASSSLEPARPVMIDPATRHEIVARHADEMKREHCMRKLEARRKELLERQALRANPGK